MNKHQTSNYRHRVRLELTTSDLSENLRGLSIMPPEPLYSGVLNLYMNTSNIVTETLVFFSSFSYKLIEFDKISFSSKPNKVEFYRSLAHGKNATPNQR